LVGVLATASDDEDDHGGDGDAREVDHQLADRTGDLRPAAFDRGHGGVARRGHVVTEMKTPTSEADLAEVSASMPAAPA
jgi:hypothetical protein